MLPASPWPSVTELTSVFWMGETEVLLANVLRGWETRFTLTGSHLPHWRTHGLKGSPLARSCRPWSRGLVEAILVPFIVSILACFCTSHLLGLLHWTPRSPQSYCLPWVIVKKQCSGEGALTESSSSTLLQTSLAVITLSRYFCFCWKSSVTKTFLKRVKRDCSSLSGAGGHTHEFSLWQSYLS